MPEYNPQVGEMWSWQSDPSLQEARVLVASAEENRIVFLAMDDGRRVVLPRSNRPAYHFAAPSPPPGPPCAREGCTRPSLIGYGDTLPNGPYHVCTMHAPMNTALHIWRDPTDNGRGLIASPCPSCSSPDTAQVIPPPRSRTIELDASLYQCPWCATLFSRVVLPSRVIDNALIRNVSDLWASTDRMVAEPHRVLVRPDTELVSSSIPLEVNGDVVGLTTVILVGRPLSARQRADREIRINRVFPAHRDDMAASHEGGVGLPQQEGTPSTKTMWDRLWDRLGDDD